MKYCLFCRDSFADDPEVCPLCGGELSDSVPEDSSTDDDSTERQYSEYDEPAGGHDPDDPMQGELVPVVMVGSEEDLRAAVEVLSGHGIDFEIVEGDRTRQLFGLVPGRSWRILVAPDKGPDAFLKLVKALPRIFPREVTERLKDELADQNALQAADAVAAALATPSADSTALVSGVITAFAGEDADAIAKVRYVLAKAGARVAPLLSQIAIESVREGGTGAEQVLFNILSVLEAIEDSTALEGLLGYFTNDVAQVRARAAYAAGRLGDPQAVDALLDLFDDEDEEVRYEASEAVWRLTGIDFDFDPYLPPAEQKAAAQAVRDAWSVSGKHGVVRNAVSLVDILRSMGDGVD